MKNKRIYPLVTETEIKDSFWTPYLEKVRTVTLPYVLERLEGDGYLDFWIGDAGGPDSNTFLWNNAGVLTGNSTVTNNGGRH